MADPSYRYGGSGYSSSYYSDEPTTYYASRYSRSSAAVPRSEVSIPGGPHSSETVYRHQYGAHSQREPAPYPATDYYNKRPRVESGSLPIYPQRPGEKDCAHYMLTRTCKFGDTCKFDHPIWVPEGGIPDWKEVQPVPTEEPLPERPGEPDCPYFMKTFKCKFGSRCRFNHPIDKSAPVEEISSALPERPSESLCSFYAKTGKCKFGPTCKFNHPKNVQIMPSVQDSNDVQETKQFSVFTPALVYNTKGLPVRQGEADCPFYMKTGSCKFGSTCRFNHPDRNEISPPFAPALNQALAASLPYVAANLLQNLPQHVPSAYPQRPGEAECDFYMKTGQCRFVERCRFHHPIDRSAGGPDSVKLTLAGLPRREGAAVCAFYLKTATCKFGATCKFDHPPPGELVAMATKHGTSTETGTETGAETGTSTKEEAIDMNEEE
ncbi:hypothetical protein LUZ60_008324 [Juncus effusus]|nr:hypothetical protein LUZ60_008324 [Juncus effusus]